MTGSSSFTDFAARLGVFIGRAAAADEFAFAALARELFALQFANVPLYRRLCEARGVTPGPQLDWRQIPAVPTTAFKELELTSLAPGERMATFHSSGTTEHRPSRHFHSAESLALYEASLLPWFARHLLAEGEQAVDAASPAPLREEIAGAGRRDLRPASWSRLFLCLAPPPEQAPHSSLVHMFAAVSHAFGTCDSRFVGRAGGEGYWSLDHAAALAVLSQAGQSGQPVVLLGTAFMFVHLLDEFARLGVSLTLPPGSRVMETGGYKGRSRELPKSELHALVTERLGVPPAFVVCEYGMSELSSQAYDHVAGTPSIRSPRSSVFSFPAWCRALVISPETGREVAEGETGLLRLFDLANVRSVLAIQTEDLALRRGDGFELLGRAARAEARGCSLLAQ